MAAPTSDASPKTVFLKEICGLNNEFKLIQKWVDHSFNY